MLIRSDCFGAVLLLTAQPTTYSVRTSNAQRLFRGTILSWYLPRPLMTWTIASAKRLLRTGLDRKPSMPADRHSSRSRSLAFAVIAMMGTLFPCRRMVCTHRTRHQLSLHLAYVHSHLMTSVRHKQDRRCMRMHRTGRTALYVRAVSKNSLPCLHLVSPYSYFAGTSWTTTITHPWT